MTHAPTHRSSRALRWLVLAVAAAMPLAGCKKELPRPDPPVVPVNVLVVEPELVHDTLRINGQIEPIHQLDVTAEVGGRVEKIFLKKGAVVRGRINGEFPGTKILKLNTDRIEPVVRRNEAQWISDQEEVRRLEEVKAKFAARAGNDNGAVIVTDRDLEQARARAAMSKATYELSKADLDRSTIYAGIDGTLDGVIDEPDTVVAPGQVVAHIVNDRKVLAVVDVPQKYVQYLAVGAEVAVEYRKADANLPPETVPDDARRRPIAFISRRADAVALTTRVEIELDNAGRRFTNAQFVYVWFFLREIPDAIMVPLTSVLNEENARAVYVVEDGKAVRREVELGFQKGMRIQITGNLKVGDRLIVKGQHLVGPGQRVSIKKPDEKSATTQPTTQSMAQPGARP